MTINDLPGSQSIYKLEAGEGKRYVFENQLATIIARKEDIGYPLAGAILTGAHRRMGRTWRKAQWKVSFAGLRRTNPLTYL